MLSKPNFAGVFPVPVPDSSWSKVSSAWTATVRRFGISRRLLRVMRPNSSWMKPMRPKLAGRVFSTVHTCGKALAAAGAFVCGSEPLRRLLINRARTFIFNTALPPYFASQVAAGMRLAASAEAERARLADLGSFLKNELQQNGFDTAGSDSHIVPVVLGSNDTALAFAANLQARGYGIRAIRTPTV